jgi:hypothetical protein
MLPNFLVIGAQKSGTTWLDRNLRAHSGIWLPPEKEIHYFDLPQIPFVFCLLAPNRRDRHWVMRRIREAYRKARTQPQHAAWYRRCYLAPRNDDWYASLFSPNEDQIAGEVAPQYAPLDDKTVAKIHALLPAIKIVYVLRNPIERMWSQVAMYHSDRFGMQGVHTLDEQRILRFVRNTKHLRHSQYSRNLQAWGKYYSQEQICVRFFEELRDTPAELLKAIFRFLGVDCSDQHISSLASTKVFAHRYSPLPGPIARELAQLLIGDIEALHRHFDNDYTAEWLESARGLMSRAS